MRKELLILTSLMSLIFTSYVNVDAQQVITSYTEDFTDSVSLDLWRPNRAEHPDGTAAFRVSQSGGVLHDTVSQVNFWDGQFYNFTEHEGVIFDISAHPYISFDVRIDTGATYDGAPVDMVAFLVSPWGKNADTVLQREFLALRMDVPDDGEWHTVHYNISDQAGLPDFDGTILENDYSEIEAILVETVVWPSVYAFTMQFDNFKVGDAAGPPATVRSYTEDFEQPVSLDLWRPNRAEHPDGTPAFNVSQAGGVLIDTVSQVNFWDGQFYNFTENENQIFDITENTYISFDVKVDTGATYGGEGTDAVAFLVSPWGRNTDSVLQREFLALRMDVPDDGEWHTMVYDISDQIGLPDFDGTILENDFSEIEAILVENVVWPDVYAFTMQLDNFKVGAAAAPPKVVKTYTEDFEEPVNLDLWNPNKGEHPDGTPAFRIGQSGGVLHDTVSQVNFWDGQFYNFTEQENLIFDITDNTFISFDVKIDTGATYGGEAADNVAFLVSPWGQNTEGNLQREFLALRMDVPDDGEWHTIVYNISDQIGLPDFDGTILENDFSELEAILVENVVWPDVYAFTMQLDNFKVGAAATPPRVVSTYTEDFEEPVSLDLWNPNKAEHPDGTPAFRIGQSGGVLHDTVSQVNFWDGQFYAFTENENLIFDITDNTYITFDVKVDTGATYGGEAADNVAFLVSPWGPNAEGSLQREFLALRMDVPDDGEWHTVRYDISEQFGLPDFDGTILENDYSEIEAILVENVVWPDVYAFTMQLDNFKVGAAAAAPRVVNTYKEDFDEPVSFDLWWPNRSEHDDGTPAFRVGQSGGVLHDTVSQVNFWDGQFYNFTEQENLIFDITDNTFITFDIRIDTGATYAGETTDNVAFLVSPWGPDDEGKLAREFLALRMDVPDDGEWHTVRYDISEQFGLPDFDGTILENDYSEIEAILVENVVWPDVYAFTMQMDNFKVGYAAAPASVVTTYTEDFEETVSLDLWRPNKAEHDDGTPAFDVSQSEGVLNNIVSQVNFWDGQFYAFTVNENLIFDITDNPYVAFDVKIDTGATYGGEATESVAFLVSPWGPNDEGKLQREFLALRMDVPDDGEWHTVQYDISEQFGLPDFDGTILENDYSEIEAILVENVVWPDVYAFTMQMDNFRVGDAAATVATREIPERLDFMAYPNPVSNTLVLESKEAIEIVKVYDMQGRLMSTSIINSQDNVSLDFSRFQPGIYLVEARSANKANTLKISKL